MKITIEELKQKLIKHVKWLNDEDGGERLVLHGYDLQNVDLRKADLQDVDLQEANLQDANLQRANWQEANLQGANLQWANLQGVNLQEANLQEANLQWANLQGVNLQRANLQGANLQNTNFSLLKLLLINWGELSDELTLECMRLDATIVGIDKMDKWANGGECPYFHKERDLIFKEKRDLWKSLKSETSKRPTMTVGELLFKLCKEKEIKL